MSLNIKSPGTVMGPDDVERVDDGQGASVGVEHVEADRKSIPNLGKSGGPMGRKLLMMGSVAVVLGLGFGAYEMRHILGGNTGPVVDGKSITPVNRDKRLGLNGTGADAGTGSLGELPAVGAVNGATPCLPGPAPVAAQPAQAGGLFSMLRPRAAAANAQPQVQNANAQMMNAQGTQGHFSNGAPCVYNPSAFVGNGAIPLAGAQGAYGPGGAGPMGRPRYRVDRSASSVMVGGSGGAVFAGGMGSQPYGQAQGQMPGQAAGYATGGAFTPFSPAPGMPQGYNPGYANSMPQARSEAGQPYSTGGGGGGRGGELANNGQSDGSSLGGRLQGTATSDARAHLIADRDFLMVKGTYLRASLDTRVDTTVPGFISGTVTRDIYSANGHILLVERGTKLSGEYQNNMTQGQNRIFVLWTRLVTPRGVVVDLASPGTDALGGAGIDGRINSHFWARYGGAFMLSVLSDGLQSGFSAGTSALSGGGGSTTNNFALSLGNTQSATTSAVQEILRSTANIKPSLYRNQGDVVGVYIARDLDFSDVYGLARSRGGR